MKKVLMTALVLWLLPSAAPAQKNSNIELPAPARRILDKKYPGWAFPEVREDIQLYFKKGNDELNLVPGDFDGNGHLDYALQIEHGIEFTDGGTTNPKIHFVALMQTKGKYKLQIVDADGGGEFLASRRKGDQGFSYETQKNFIFANDAVEAIYFEKAAVAYIYEKGRFRAITTGD